MLASPFSRIVFLFFLVGGHIVYLAHCASDATSDATNEPNASLEPSSDTLESHTAQLAELVGELDSATDALRKAQPTIRGEEEAATDELRLRIPSLPDTVNALLAKVAKLGKNMVIKWGTKWTTGEHKTSWEDYTAARRKAEIVLVISIISWLSVDASYFAELKACEDIAAHPVLLTKRGQIHLDSAGLIISPSGGLDREPNMTANKTTMIRHAVGSYFWAQHDTSVCIFTTVGLRGDDDEAETETLRAVNQQQRGGVGFARVAQKQKGNKALLVASALHVNDVNDLTARILHFKAIVDTTLAESNRHYVTRVIYPIWARLISERIGRPLGKLLCLRGLMNPRSEQELESLLLMNEQSVYDELQQKVNAPELESMMDQFGIVALEEHFSTEEERKDWKKNVLISGMSNHELRDVAAAGKAITKVDLIDRTVTNSKIPLPENDWTKEAGNYFVASLDLPQLSDRHIGYVYTVVQIPTENNTTPAEFIRAINNHMARSRVAKLAKTSGQRLLVFATFRHASTTPVDAFVLRFKQMVDAAIQVTSTAQE